MAWFSSANKAKKVSPHEEEVSNTKIVPNLDPVPPSSGSGLGVLGNEGISSSSGAAANEAMEKRFMEFTSYIDDAMASVSRKFTELQAELDELKCREGNTLAQFKRDFEKHVEKEIGVVKEQVQELKGREGKHDLEKHWQNEIAAVREQVQEGRIHDLLRQITDSKDHGVWTQLLQAEVTAARGLHIAGFAGRPFFCKLVQTALKNRADPNALSSKGNSLLSEVLNHHCAQDDMQSTATVAAELVAAGAKLGKSEVDSLAGAWGQGIGQEFTLQDLVRQADNEVKEVWEEARLKYCSEEERNAEAGRRQRPFHKAGVTLRQFLELYADHKDWIEAPAYNAFAQRDTARNMHDIVRAIVKPRTEWRKCSYTDLLPAGQIDVFVSHNWAEEFPDFVQTLTAFANANHAALNKAPGSVRFWVCSFVICQHSVELGSTLLESPFAQALKHCELVVCAVDDAASLFTRIWCVFEMFYSISHKKRIELVCPDGPLTKSASLTKYQLAALKALTAFDPESAEASRPEDYDLIMREIRSAEGGVDKVKRVVQSMVGLMYRLGELEKEFIDPFTGETISILHGTVPLRLRLRAGEECSAKEFVQQHVGEEGMRITIVAEPGSGKTVLTKQLVLYAIDAARTTLVARVPAGDLRTVLGEDLLIGWIEHRCSPGSPDVQVFHDPAGFNFTHTLLVLDGLDEAQNETDRVLRWVLQWAQAGHRSVIITSRPSALLPERDALLKGANFERVDLADMSLEDAKSLAKLRLGGKGDVIATRIGDAVASFKGHALVQRPLLCCMLIYVLDRRLREAPEEDPTRRLRVSDVYYEAIAGMLREVPLGAHREFNDMVACKHAADARLIAHADLPIDVAKLVHARRLPLLAKVHGGFQLFHLSLQEFLFARAVFAGTAELSTDPRDANVRELLKDMQEAWKEMMDAAVTHPDASHRTNAALGLSSIDGKKAWKEMMDAALTHPDASHRTNAALGLSSIDGKKAWTELMDALLTHSYENHRTNAALALSSIDGKQALQALKKALESDSNWEVRLKAAKGLGNIGGPEALQPLKHALESDKDRVVRMAAAEALGKIGGPEALQVLKKALESDSEWLVRREAATGLGNIGGPEALQALKKALEADKEALVRMAAAEALGNIGGPEAIMALKAKAAKGDRYDGVKRAVAEALTKLGA